MQLTVITHRIARMDRDSCPLGFLANSGPGLDGRWLTCMLAVGVGVEGGKVKRLTHAWTMRM